jgi:hypothetical protein
MKRHPSVVMSHAAVQVIGDLGQAEIFKPFSGFIPRSSIDFAAATTT